MNYQRRHTLFGEDEHDERKQSNNNDQKTLTERNTNNKIGQQILRI